MFASFGFAGTLSGKVDQALGLQVARAQAQGSFPIGQRIVQATALVVLEPALDELSDFQRDVLGHDNLVD
jgi:hypothetical protein